MDNNVLADIAPEKIEELLALAAAAVNPEAIAKLAAEQDIELSAEQAKALFDRLNADAALSDDEMDKVAGGFPCWNAPCEDWQCPTNNL